MRNLKQLALLRGRVVAGKLGAGKTLDDAGEDIQARYVAFFAYGEQHLLAYAYAQQGLVARGPQDGFTQPRYLQGAHAVAHGALARKNHPRGAVYVLRFTADLYVGIGGRCLQGASH